MQRSFEKSEQLRELTPMTYLVLVSQLDEETGIRGYAAAGDPNLLEPYYAGSKRFTTLVIQLKRGLSAADIPLGIEHLERAIKIHDLWIKHTVAPLLLHTRDKTRIIMRGKGMMDQFRIEIGAVVLALNEAESNNAIRTEKSIDRIDVMLGVMAFVIIIGGLIFGFRHRESQARLAIAEQELVRESERAERLHAENQVERRIAQRLQTTIARRPLPVIPSLYFSASYVPATEEVKVGGDWYDAFELSNDRVLFAIGDVAGHGIDAAVTMNQVRQLLIAAALQEYDPARILHYVNNQLISVRSPMVTAIIGYADGKTCQFTYATAGHPLPVLIEPNRPPRFLQSEGLALGINSHESYTTQCIQSLPGAILVLYTDGAIEHSRDILLGEKMLLDAVSSLATNQVADPAQAIHNRIFADHNVEDDVAILTVGFSPTINITN